MGLYLGSTKIPTISFYKQSGITPSGIFTIPSNSGTYDITNYAFAKANFENNLKLRISGDLTEYSNSTASIISPYAFAGTTILSVSMPSVVQIYEGAFKDCPSIA